MKQIENTKAVLARDLKKYVQIILEEFKNSIPENRKKYLLGIDDFSRRLVIENTGTVSFFVSGNDFYIPENAYRIFRMLRRIPGYGINRKKQLFKEGSIINDNTYYDYMKYVFVSGMSVQDFFRDSLLHETMHFCGSGGENALSEGLTELKTREIAQKYGLKASRCGYPKEVDIAYRLQNIIGIDVTNSICFARDNYEIFGILQKNCGTEIANLYIEISDLMDEEMNFKYDHSKFGGIFGPIKKARAYSKIDYSIIYKKIEEFENRLPRTPNRDWIKYNGNEATQTKCEKRRDAKRDSKGTPSGAPEGDINGR